MNSTFLSNHKTEMHNHCLKYLSYVNVYNKKRRTLSLNEVDEIGNRPNFVRTKEYKNDDK